MKKIFFTVAVFAMILTFTACGSSSDGEGGSTMQYSDVSETTGSKSLVVYFSWSGNTENVAKSIQRQTEADLYEIVPKVPYSDDYDTVVELAQEEQDENARPEIAGDINGLNDYDIVYIGFPIWWGDMPMILYSFFDDHDLSGKTIAPFCTSGGSGLSNTVKTIKELEPDAVVTDGLHIGNGDASEADDIVADWLNINGIR